jgi:putative ABC transport system ATP-binding protein
MLELTDIRKEYQKGQKTVEALAGISLSIEKGEFLSIAGPSGSGKTTLLNILGCLDTPTTGSVRYNGVELHSMDENRLAGYRRDNIAFIFQSYNLIPVLTVRENVELPLEIEKKYSKREMSERALKVIDAVGLSGMADRLPKELSGGQEQRVAIARALVKTPLVVLADEPTANLDSRTAEEIMAIMREMNGSLQTTFIFSTHDPLVQKHARRKIILKDGKIAGDEAK